MYFPPSLCSITSQSLVLSASQIIINLQKVDPIPIGGCGKLLSTGIYVQETSQGWKQLAQIPKFQTYVNLYRTMGSLPFCGGI